MSADQPSAFNLEHLRKNAKRLLRACRALDVDAIATIQATLSGFHTLDTPTVARTIKLADVHQALAMQRGFSSWGDLIRWGDPLARLLTAIRGGHVSMLRRELPGFSGLAASNILAASALGDARALAQHLTCDRSLATTARDGWTPLDYVCSSPVARLSTRHAASLCDCAELLLAAGADPSTAVDDERIQNARVPAIMRAILAGNLGLIVILKKAGAQEPHAALQQWMATRTTSEDVKLHQIFREYFSRPDVRERFKGFKARMGEFTTQHGTHAPMPADPRELQHLRLPNLLEAQEHLWSALLDKGYDPASIGVTGRSALHTLVTYAPASFVDMFLERGVDLNVRDADGRSVYSAAVRAGNLEVAKLLRARGIADTSTLMDHLIGLCLADEAEAAQALVADHPGLLETVTRADADELVRAAARGAIGQVRVMLACGFPPDAADESGATALQQAAWRGQVPTVELLLAFGASPTVRDDLYGETALDWAHHGASHAHGAERACLEAARLIEAAAAR